MGVRGLWRLLDSFGTVIQPDDLKGTRVAIDASIWIAQFRARSTPGEDVEHKVLEGFLARILKLLFYGIKPVFVFDGRASSNKGAEHYRRMRQRAANAQALLKRRAKQIFMAQLASGSIGLTELNKAMQAEAEHGAASAAKEEGGKNSSVVLAPSTTNNVSEDILTSGVVPTVEATDCSRAVRKVKGEAEDAAAAHPLPRKRSRAGPRLQRHHNHRCRCLLAPDTVSSRNTMHFLQDVEGLLEERTKREARVFHNALRNTSTSLFMGPRHTVNDEENGVDNRRTGHAVPPIPTRPSFEPVSVDDDNEAQHAGYAHVISVTVSDEDSNYVEESDEDNDSNVTSSDCCALSSSSEVSVIEDGAVVQVARRTASPHAPSKANSSVVFHSGDLTRFLTTLSQSTPSVLTSFQREQSAKTENKLRGYTTVKEETVGKLASHIVSPALSVDNAEGGGNDDSESGTDKEFDEEDEESGSDRSAEEEDEENSERENGRIAVDAAVMAWEPFTQRMSPAPPLQYLVTPPNSTTSSAATSPRIDDDDDEDDFTPVKLRQGPPHTMASHPAVVVLVNGSDGDEESNPTVHGSAPHLSGVSAEDTSRVAAEEGDGGNATGGGRLSDSPTTVPRTRTTHRSSSTRSTVSVIPFELLRVVELLDCCGVPYVLSPAEADAQCAFLARNGLVDAVFTEDSDVLVHGATTVLRGFFSHSKNVVAYKQAELAACGVTKTVLVALASLLGCDYTDGVPGIGLVSALQALVVAWTSAENREDKDDSPQAALHVLRRWCELVRHPPKSWHDVDDDMTLAQFALFGSAIKQWHFLEKKSSFPEMQAVEAFYDAEVDTDVTPFTWLPPDWQQIRIFAGACGALSSTWFVQQFELARKKWLNLWAEAEKSGAAHENGQRRLTEYGAQERVRAEWAYQKQPHRHATVLSQLRAVQLIR